MTKSDAVFEPDKHKILLVEDNPLTVKLVRLTLETEGYSVLVCTTGEEAHQTLDRVAPDIILQDMRLPDTDGLQLIKELRAMPNGESIPIIAFSGFISMVEEARIANAGFTDFLLKPVEPSLLVKCIANHLPSKKSTTRVEGHNRLVLIVDDDPIQLKFTGLQFAHAGFKVISGADGVQGLELAQQYVPDVIVSDVLMPRMDGFQFCKAVREDDAIQHIPIVLCSANYVEDIDQKLASKIGANGYVYRSQGIQKIIDTVESCLASHTPSTSNGGSIPSITDAEIDADIDDEIHNRMLQQLERQVSLNLVSRQRSYVQHTILGQIGAIADSLIQFKGNQLVLDDILARCLDSAGLSHGVFYYGDAHNPLKLRAQFGFAGKIDELKNGLNCRKSLIKVMQGEIPIAVPTFKVDCEISDNILQTSGSRSALLVPIRGKEGAWGLFIMFADQQLLIEEDWISFGRNVAQQFAQATELSDTFSRLAESEKRFRQLAENIQEAFFLVSPIRGQVLYVSPAYERIWGRSLDQIHQEPSSILQSVLPPDRPKVAALIDALRNTGLGESEFRITQPDGDLKWIVIRGFPIFDENGKLSRIAGTAEDITARKHAQFNILRMNRLYALLSNINNLIVRADSYQELFNDACRVAVQVGEFDLAWMGFINHEDDTIAPIAKFGTEEDMQALAREQFRTTDENRESLSLIPRAISKRQPQWETTFRSSVEGDVVAGIMKLKGYRSAICLPLLNEENVIGVVMLYSKRTMTIDSVEIKLLTEISQDISFAVDYLKTKDRLHHLAYHDTVTGLGNRSQLLRMLDNNILEAEKTNNSFGLILININNFREINDTLGHSNGDLLLTEVGARLLATSKQTDFVGCLGGDEFAILINPVESKIRISEIANRIGDALHESIQISGVPILVEIRAGTALYPKHGKDANTLWRRADVALSAAKKYKEFMCIYHEAYDDFDPLKLSLLGELRDAIDNNHLVLHWQPKINLTTKTTCGFEALIRWQHPTRGLLFPDSFIPIIERTALIKQLTDWVIIKAIQQASLWHQMGYELDVAINISVRNLQEPDIDKKIMQAAHAVDFPVKNIIVEITESAVMEDTTKALGALQKLRSAGMQIAIDDFGTGHSSLTYLKDLPVTDMKIDKSFVMDLSRTENYAIVKSTIDLAKNLSLTTTAEGVEDKEKLEILKDLGCEVAQGYFISKPFPTNQIIEWINNSVWPSVKLCEDKDGNSKLAS
ncbi:EAL domain-containing protein [Simiduia aestuariiviva]|uniref:Diguanylate cyclase (GGDEF)-like protein/PAS domain S-box-containing protein n=1 Tax=Simiduia aestuariiviva TaxID=1510459 RepID=A0A839UWA4_9GAMM|nr:EAL domain-containing protein [Simiduia aestuariiviva]MBB3169605.1 diguanylate cyclase (GGDEF)-like protein/PAS domain S-box-containing protein [Simiduia aestuariiviva]